MITIFLLLRYIVWFAYTLTSDGILNRIQILEGALKRGWPKMGACMDQVKISSIPEKEKQRQRQRQRDKDLK